MSSSNYDSSSPRAGLVARATTSSPHLRAGAAGDLERPPSPSPDLTAVPTLRTPRPRQSGYRGLCRPSLARVHAPTPSPSAFSPSPPHVSSGGGGNYSEWRVQLLAFLNEYAINSEKTAVYKVLAALTRETSSLSFQIHFEHLLEYDKELAYAICNSQDSIKPLEQFLSEHGSLISIKSIFKGSYKLCVAHDIGMVLVHGFLEEILKNHRKDLSWNGGFNKSDLVVVNSMECRITKRSTQGGCHCRAKDLHKIGEIFMPMFSCSRGMALYFDVLQKDLSMASDTEVKEEWFWEYLLSHPALKRSMARYDLECGLHAAITFGGPGTRIQSILGVYSDWKALIPTELTENTLVTDSSLYKVFWFNCEPIEGVDNPFAATVGGLLAYKRNFLQYGNEYVKVHDPTELEQFAAKTFPQALPNILRKLLRDCKIHMNGPLMVPWKAYCASRVHNDDNTEGRTDICI